MKAKEVMKKYNITRVTLSHWVKRGWIKVDILPSGRYNYIEIKEIYILSRLLIEKSCFFYVLKIKNLTL